MTPEHSALAVFLRERFNEDTADIQADSRHWSDVPYEACGTLRLRAELDAKRGLLDLLLDTRHTVCEDPWYTCRAATLEREGETSIAEPRWNTCGCGRDSLVLAGLQLLARPYAAHPDYRPEWAPDA